MLSEESRDQSAEFDVIGSKLRQCVFTLSNGIKHLLRVPGLRRSLRIHQIRLRHPVPFRVPDQSQGDGDTDRCKYRTKVSFPKVRIDGGGTIRAWTRYRKRQCDPDVQVQRG